MAIDWNRARQLMTSNPAYRGAPRGGAFSDRATGKFSGSPGERKSRRFSAPQRGGAFSDIATGKFSGSPRATDFKTSGDFRRGIANTGRRFTTPLMNVMGRLGDTVSDAMRGSRLHKEFKNKYGGSDEWKAAKASMMTPEDEAFYNKYMDLYETTGDESYKDTAETAWRNKQTSDRLAAYLGFEDYLPGKYTGEGEGARYTGGRKKGQLVPGVGRMQDILDGLRGPASPGETIGAVGGPIPDPDMDITADLISGIDYDEMGLAPDPENDLVPGDYDFREPRYDIEDPVFETPGGLYDYPDEKYLPAPFDPWADIYDFERQRQKAYFTPKLLDEDRVHSTLPLGRRTLTSAPGEVTYPYGENLLDQPRTWNPGRGQQIFPNISVEFTGDDEEERRPTRGKGVNWWNKAYGG